LQRDVGVSQGLPIGEREIYIRSQHAAEGSIEQRAIATVDIG
jgi:hypothetical protein